MIQLIWCCRLTRKQRLRLAEAQVVQRKKEEVYAARLGYDLMGDQIKVRRRTGASLLKGTSVFQLRTLSYRKYIEDLSLYRCQI